MLDHAGPHDPVGFLVEDQHANRVLGVERTDCEDGGFLGHGHLRHAFARCLDGHAGRAIDDQQQRDLGAFALLRRLGQDRQCVFEQRVGVTPDALVARRPRAQRIGQCAQPLVGIVGEARALRHGRGEARVRLEPAALVIGRAHFAVHAPDRVHGRVVPHPGQLIERPSVRFAECSHAGNHAQGIAIARVEVSAERVAPTRNSLERHLITDQD